jgi:hypothetical protein
MEEAPVSPAGRGAFVVSDNNAEASALRNVVQRLTKDVEARDARIKELERENARLATELQVLKIPRAQKTGPRPQFTRSADPEDNEE